MKRRERERAEMKQLCLRSQFSKWELAGATTVVKVDGTVDVKVYGKVDG